jgi:hypothetical protein
MQGVINYVLNEHFSVISFVWQPTVIVLRGKLQQLFPPKTKFPFVAEGANLRERERGGG